MAQWDDQKLNLRIIGAKSVLLTTALRRQSPLHKEAFGLQLALTQAHPYLLQSKSNNNFIFTDASVLSYITRNKAFNNFLQALSENLSYYKGLSIVHISGHANSYCDILSRALDLRKKRHKPEQGGRIDNTNYLSIRSWNSDQL